MVIDFYLLSFEFGLHSMEGFALGVLFLHKRAMGS
jgi:hypothetical protein